jgi:hypothetical protein
MKRTLILAASAVVAIGLLAAPPARAQRDTSPAPAIDPGVPAPKLLPSSAAARPGATPKKTDSISWFGPTYPPPGGLTFTQSGLSNDGSIGRASGKQWFYSGMGLPNTTSVYWGPNGGQIEMSFDGNSYSGAEVMSLNFLDGLNGIAIWTGQTHFSNSTLVYTRFRLVATNGLSGSGPPQPIESAGISGITNSAGVVLPVGPGAQPLRCQQRRIHRRVQLDRGGLLVRAVHRHGQRDRGRRDHSLGERERPLRRTEPDLPVLPHLL